jgi:hypothetical protein
MPFGKKMQAELDRMFKETGHQNAIFHYSYLKACLKQKKKMRKDLQRVCDSDALQIEKMIQTNRVSCGRSNAKLEESLLFDPQVKRLFGQL